MANVLQLGCGLDPAEVFYSSGADTGVPDGSDLLAHVRDRVGSADLVVALITHTYLSRPICMAERGAAWGVVGEDKRFPLLAPGMKREDLIGILPSLLIRYGDDRGALDALHDRVGRAVGRRSDTATWGRHVRKWEVAVSELAANLPVPQVASVSELDRLREQLAERDEVIDDMEQQIVELERQLLAVSDLKDRSAVAQATLPKGNQERFEALVAASRKALSKVSAIVKEAIRCDVSGRQMRWPNGFDDPQAHSEVERALDDGELLEGSYDDTLVPDYEIRAASEARDAILKLIAFIETEAEPQLHEVFEEEHGVPLDLRRRQAWEGLLGT